MRRSFALLLLAASLSPHAYAARAEVCYDYGCGAHAAVQLDDEQWHDAAVQFDEVKDSATERAAVSNAVGWLYFHAALQTPIWRDHGGNRADGDAEGRMDCIDHSTNTTTWLRLIEARGLLRHHRVLDPVRRGFFNAHWTARLRDLDTGEEWAVDSWFNEPGYPAAIMPLPLWFAGVRPQPERVAQ
jgi:hypothetical protein